MRLKKWKYGLIAGILFLLSGLAYAQFVYEKVTVGSTVATLTAAKYGVNVKSGFITCEDSAIRFTVDGITVPTFEGVGHRLEIGQSLYLNKYQVVNFKAVRASATDANLRVTYSDY